MSGKKKGTRNPREERWGLRDMYRDRPTGEAGQIYRMVWGNSLQEFEQIIEFEQRQNPDKFFNKIGPKGPPKK
jgi:hypothetical protein